MSRCETCSSITFLCSNVSMLLASSVPSLPYRVSSSRGSVKSLPWSRGCIASWHTLLCALQTHSPLRCSPMGACWLGKPSTMMDSAGLIMIVFSGSRQPLTPPCLGIGYILTSRAQPFWADHLERPLFVPTVLSLITSQASAPLTTSSSLAPLAHPYGHPHLGTGRSHTLGIARSLFCGYVSRGTRSDLRSGRLKSMQPGLLMSPGSRKTGSHLNSV